MSIGGWTARSHSFAGPAVWMAEGCVAGQFIGSHAPAGRMVVLDVLHEQLGHCVTPVLDGFHRSWTVSPSPSSHASSDNHVSCFS